MAAASLWRSVFLVAGGGCAAALVAITMTNCAPVFPGDEPTHLDPITALVWGLGCALLVWLGLQQFHPARRPDPPDPQREDPTLYDQHARSFDSLLRAAVKGSPARRDELAAVIRSLARARAATSGRALSAGLEDLCRRAEAGQPARRFSRASIDDYLKEIGSL